MVAGIYHNVENLFDFAASETKRIGTGIQQVDRLIRGPAPGEICMIMGRSYSGKSIIGQNIIYYNRDKPSIFFSMEMPAMQAIIRLYSMWSDTPSTQVQEMVEAGDPPTDLWDMVPDFEHHEIDDTSGITIGEMSERVAVFEEEHGMRPEFVVVDYLELLGGAKQSGEGYIATEMQSTMLKDWARLENMRVFVLHQTNRQERQWMPPTENSARNAGFTEADFVIGLWRPHTNPDLGPMERLSLKNKIAVNVLKNRAFFMESGRSDIIVTPSLRVWREDNSDRKPAHAESSQGQGDYPDAFSG